MAITRPIKLASGGVLQAGIPKVAATPPGPFHALVRGVVLATYTCDDEAHPLRKLGLTPSSVYCDCLCFSSMDGGSSYFFLPAVAVTQPFGGLHKGAVYKPRATTRLTSDKPLSAITPVDVSQMDGDHVLIGFLEGRTNHPVIVGHLPHPSRDLGNDPALPAGQRQKLNLVDGDPLFMAHHGSRFGVGTDGSFLVDTTRANSGGLTPTSGDAPTLPGQGNISLQVPIAAYIGAAICDASVPAVPAVLTSLRLQAGKLSFDTGPVPPQLSVSCLAGNALSVSGAGAAAIARIGSATSPVALADALEVFWGAVQASFALHTHQSVAGTPLPLTGPAIGGLPGYAAAITGSALRIPST
jgi:hypothetical protein